MANWNPWHGCRKISAGCKNCYVYRMDKVFEKDSSNVTKNNSFDLPVRKNRYNEFKIVGAEMVYTCFSSDFLLEDADAWRKEAWDMIYLRKDLNFLFITKRIDRLGDVLPENWQDGYDNVIIGCTCENQDRADYRLPIFLSLPIKHRFITCEPLLENIDLSPYLGSKIEFVVAGGESGSMARLCEYSWVLNLREQCVSANVPFWFKQTGTKFKKDGKIYYIKRKYQHSQASKADINYNYTPLFD